MIQPKYRDLQIQHTYTNAYTYYIRINTLLYQVKILYVIVLETKKTIQLTRSARSVSFLRVITYFRLVCFVCTEQQVGSKFVTLFVDV